MEEFLELLAQPGGASGLNNLLVNAAQLTSGVRGALNVATGRRPLTTNAVQPRQIAPAGKDNTMLYMGLAAAGVLVLVMMMNKKKGGRRK